MRRQAMKNECGRLNAECGAERRVASVRSAFSIHPSAFPLPPSPSPRLTYSLQPTAYGLTLIELLVTIVIMVTVLAGVIPLMSPNNNARKIREASRQLSTMLAQAQAQAARDGRPVGVAFREFGADSSSLSGMALEAFMIAEPQPFAGFSEFSQVVINGSPVGVYGAEMADGQNGGILFSEYDGEDIYELSFNLGTLAAADQLPPSTFRFGDIIEVDGHELMIVDDNKAGELPNKVLDPTDPLSPLDATAQLECVWISRKPGQFMPPGLRMYQIRRLPANTSDAPLQFPRGIGIDLQASGAVPPPGVAPPNDFPTDFDVTSGSPPDVIGVMFNANGAMDELYVNGRSIPNVHQIFMLLGVFENGNNGSQEHLDYNFKDNQIATGDKEALPQRRSRINWLNADSRWVTVNRAGRVVTSANNTSFDPSQSPYIDGLTGGTDRRRSNEQRERQLNGVGNNPGARAFAAQMQTEGGR